MCVISFWIFFLCALPKFYFSSQLGKFVEIIYIHDILRNKIILRIYIAYKEECNCITSFKNVCMITVLYTPTVIIISLEQIDQKRAFDYNTKQGTGIYFVVCIALSSVWVYDKMKVFFWFANSKVIPVYFMCQLGTLRIQNV